jgi:NAD(P)-dependent dehydrogenase (short-subunit alcohol dehydrogenase family)
MAKAWFITGISSGLGRKMTEQLLARGDRVAGTARKLHVLDGLKSRYANLQTAARYSRRGAQRLYPSRRPCCCLGRVYWGWAFRGVDAAAE